jgi:hypothetical protein
MSEPFFKNSKVVGTSYSPEKYHSENGPRGGKDYAVGRSALMEFCRCEHRWVAGFEMEDTNATEWGSAFDCLLLTPERFAADYAVCPATYPDKKTGEEKPWTFAATFCKEWRAEHEGRQIIKADVYEEITGALKSAKADQVIGDVLKGADCQVYITAEYHDSTTGLVIPVKTLIDIVPHVGSSWGRSLWDLKSARNAAPGPWPRVIFERGYDVQAAMSMDIYAAARPDEDRVDFRHAIIEAVKPFEPGKRLIAEEFVTRGRMVYQQALARYAVCLKTGEWGGYDKDAEFQGCTISSPEAWMMNP